MPRNVFNHVNQWIRPCDRSVKPTMQLWQFGQLKKSTLQVKGSALRTAAKRSLLIEPLIHQFNHSPQIMLADEAKERALHDFAQFKESLEFDTLVNDAHQSLDSEQLLKAEANRLLERYSEESTEGIKNLMSDGLAFVTFLTLIYFGRQQMITLKSLIDRVFLD